MFRNGETQNKAAATATCNSVANATPEGDMWSKRE
jgi:hypothetical protein